MQHLSFSTVGLAQEILQHFLHFGRNQHGMSVVNFEHPACKLQRREAIRFLAHAQRIVKMA